MELLTHFLQLPVELQSLLKEYILVKNFKEWYISASQMCHDKRPSLIKRYYFENVMLWSHRMLQ